MNEVIEKENIETKIYEVRGKQVMLDSDLAKLYNVETKRINEAVKNNPNKFPERFSWILDEYELKNLRSRISTSNSHGGRRYSTRVFTEQGVAMLATILKSKTATKVSISIMDAFVSMRKFISSNLLKQKYYNDMVIRHDEEIRLLQETFETFEKKKKINEIYFNGQIYDAYSKVLDIFKEAKERLIIVDGYADKVILEIISKLKIEIIILTYKNSLLSKMDIERYNKQYSNLKVIYDNSFHDRYFIIDGKTIYHCGASINRIGYKTFSINKIDDEIVREALLNNVNKKIN